MEYTVIINSRSYDLPPRTIAVLEELDEMSRIDDRKDLSVREKFSRLFKFITKLVGKDNALQILGSDDFTKVDTAEITLAFQKIVDAYQRPVREYQLTQAQMAIGDLPIEELKALKGLLDAQKAK